jgi:hypothetical protein
MTSNCNYRRSVPVAIHATSCTIRARAERVQKNRGDGPAAAFVILAIALAPDIPTALATARATITHDNAKHPVAEQLCAAFEAWYFDPNCRQPHAKRVVRTKGHLAHKQVRLGEAALEIPHAILSNHPRALAPLRLAKITLARIGPSALIAIKHFAQFVEHFCSNPKAPAGESFACGSSRAFLFPSSAHGWPIVLFSFLSWSRVLRTTPKKPLQVTS